MNFLLSLLMVGSLHAAPSTPEQVVKEFWGALKKEDFKTAHGLLSSKSQQKMDLKKFKKNFNPKELPKDMRARLKLKGTKQAKLEGDSALVKATVERPEFEKLMQILPQKLMALAYSNKQQQMNPKEMEKILLEETRKLPQKTSDEDVHLVREGGAWKVDLEKTRGGFALPVIPTTLGM